jgi:hypothetical protein
MFVNQLTRSTKYGVTSRILFRPTSRFMRYTELSETELRFIVDRVSAEPSDRSRVISLIIPIVIVYYRGTAGVIQVVSIRLFFIPGLLCI